MHSKWFYAGVILIGLVIGLMVGGYAGFKYGGSKKICEKTECPIAAASTDTVAPVTTGDALVACLKAKWGEDKYTAITANPSLASTDDKFNALPCYK